MSKYFKRIPIFSFTVILLFLCGFGVYLGRYLRYNSWEIISAPQQLISDIVNIVILPIENSEAWLFTFGFGGFLIVGYWVFKSFYSAPST